MNKTVFATSDYNGYFEELVIINNDQIIEFLGEDEETEVNMVRVIDNGVEDIWYYIDYIDLSNSK